MIEIGNFEKLLLLKKSFHPSESLLQSLSFKGETLIEVNFA